MITFIPDQPAPANVRAGIVYDDGALIGTLEVFSEVRAVPAPVGAIILLPPPAPFGAYYA